MFSSKVRNVKNRRSHSKYIKTKNEGIFIMFFLLIFNYLLFIDLL